LANTISAEMPAAASLTSLNLSQNRIGAKGSEALAQVPTKARERVQGVRARERARARKRKRDSEIEGEGGGGGGGGRGGVVPTRILFLLVFVAACRFFSHYVCFCVVACIHIFRARALDTVCGLCRH
jgi:hypothetical protein